MSNLRQHLGMPRSLRSFPRATCVCLLLLLMSRIFGCEYVYRLTIRGVVADAQTRIAIVDAPIGVITITEGQITGAARAVDDAGEPLGITTDANASFVLSVDSFSRIPNPDRLQIIVVRNGCEQRLMIGINDENSQFYQDESLGSVLELNEPIFVPPCEESP
jgi:hypothetical protein